MLDGFIVCGEVGRHGLMERHHLLHRRLELHNALCTRWREKGAAGAVRRGGVKCKPGNRELLWSKKSGNHSKHTTTSPVTPTRATEAKQQSNKERRSQRGGNRATEIEIQRYRATEIEVQRYRDTEDTETPRYRPIEITAEKQARNRAKKSATEREKRDGTDLLRAAGGRRGPWERCL